MTPLLAALFLDAIPVQGLGRIAMTLPLCLAISVVYKAIRCADTRDIARSAIPLWITIVVGMYVVGFVLGGLFLLLA